MNKKTHKNKLKWNKIDLNILQREIETLVQFDLKNNMKL
jgi:hypothetical protein